MSEWLVGDPLAIDPAIAAPHVADDVSAMRAEAALVVGGLGKADAKRLVKAWRDAGRPQRQPREAEELELPDSWAAVPYPYMVSARGVMREAKTPDGPQLVRVTVAPVYVSERQVDVTTGAESWVLRYWQGARWHSVDAARDVCQAARSIVALASRGLPVSSATAAGMVEWLELFAAENDIPTTHTTRQFGWVRKAWVMGDEGPVRPAGGDPEGVGLLSRACRPAGTAEGWLGGLAVAAKYPAVMVALGASLASPCLALTSTPGFVVSFDGRSSAGKTTAQRFAASVWGCGDELSSTPYIRTWDWTHNAREAWCHALNHLPCIVDDTRRATGHADRLVEAVYQMAHGQGRARMTDGRSAQETRRWRLVTITSGEDAITQMGTAGGLRARVIQIWGSPFNGAAADDVAAINRIATTHYGYAGRAWVASLSAERVLVLKERIDARSGSLAASGEVGARLGGYAALIEAVLWCAAEWLGWPMGGEELADWVRPTLAGAIDAVSQDADPADRCWADMWNWLASNPTRIERGTGEQVPTEAPSMGYIARANGREWALATAEVRKWAEGMGYRLDAALRQWAADGRLERKDPPHMASWRKIAGVRCMAYTLRIEE